jgi:succinyl-diaminopimelate desuccinylase
MGELGSQFLLDTVPHAKADAMISADAGSPRVLRFGEKGMIWLSMHARGRSAHAAHVHLGDSAIDRLLAAIGELRRLQDYPIAAPQLVLQAIDVASPLSEPLSGAGESDVLKSITVTISMIHGGRLPNLVADTAEARVDILPLTRTGAVRTLGTNKPTSTPGRAVTSHGATSTLAAISRPDSCLL